MEDTCYILRPDLVLKIDRSQNPRPALYRLLENIAVGSVVLLTKPIEFFGNSFFIRRIHSLVIFCPHILILANNHAVYMGSLSRIRIRRKLFGQTPCHASDKIGFRSARFDICQPVYTDIASRKACLCCVLCSFPEVTFHKP